MAQEIVQETLDSIKEYLPKLIRASHMIAEDIQSNQGTWVDTLMQYIEGMNWLIQAINGIQKVDEDALSNWELASLSAIFHQMNEALEQEDFVMLSDLLQYEISPLLNSYDEQLRGNSVEPS
ncbi:hypothetical protein [Brevibacillus fulvus]|uniref:Uncharacterized protein (UPF0261 family) n=1 Tax=Brevibacillus fulvus TaxID=1125967 RepID=A0A939BVI3_9BACL|nr:hypothetical protein [Brevibacillus fulvus]MBM7591499.1 uncharacterized protein (UPF0261 family) [Brevibacillus fulvus]